MIKNKSFDGSITEQLDSQTRELQLSFADNFDEIGISSNLEDIHMIGCSGCFFAVSLSLSTVFGFSSYKHSEIIAIPPAVPETVLFADQIAQATLLWRGNQTNMQLQNQIFYIR